MRSARTMTSTAIAWVPVVLGFIMACTFLFMQSAAAVEDSPSAPAQTTASDDATTASTFLAGYAQPVEHTATSPASAPVRIVGGPVVNPARVEAGQTMARLADIESGSIGIVALGCVTLLSLVVTGGLAVSRRDAE